MNKKTKTSSRLKQIMAERGYKQVDILNMAKPYCEKYNTKLNKNDLSQYISGKNEPGQRKIMVLSECLNVSPSWLMGLDVPKERENNGLNAFLASISYNDIESLVKNDKNHELLHYIDSMDIIAELYFKNMPIVKEREESFQKMEKIYLSLQESLKKIDADNILQPVSVKKSIVNIQNEDKSMKKRKLLYCMKKYYNTNCVLEELDNRELFKITDKKGQPIKDKKTRYSLISDFLDSAFKKMKNQNDSHLK